MRPTYPPFEALEVDSRWARYTDAFSASYRCCHVGTPEVGWTTRWYALVADMLGTDTEMAPPLTATVVEEIDVGADTAAGGGAGRGGRTGCPTAAPTPPTAPDRPPS